jgi:hypothetical protein
MQLKSSYFLILLGTLGFLSLSGRSVMATELPSSEATLSSQTGSQNQATPEPSISPQPTPEVQPPPVLPTPDSEQLAQNAPILTTPDTPEPEIPKSPVPTVVEQPSQEYEPPSVAFAPPEEASAPEVTSVPVDVALPDESNLSDTSENPPIERVPMPAPEPDDPPPNRDPADQKQGTQKLNKLGQLTFVCGSDNGTPKTIAKLNNRELGVILWTSTAFTAKGFDPQTRCKQVSARFEEYNQANQLIYLTSGKMNGQAVICATTKENGDCGDISPHDGLLFTLKPSSNVEELLEQLANVLAIENNTPAEPLKE